MVETEQELSSSPVWLLVNGHSNLQPHTITLHLSLNGNIVLQFGATMIHLQPDVFQQVADMLNRCAEQMSQSAARMEIGMPYGQPGDA